MRLPIKSVTIVRSTGTDKVYLNLQEDKAREIRGQYYPVFKGASLTLDITHGDGKNAVRRMGWMGPITVIETQKGKTIIPAIDDDDECDDVLLF